MTEKELREFWAKLAGDVGEKDEGDKVTLGTVAKTLREGAHGVFQHVFNLGHSEATARAAKAEKELKDQLEAKTAEVTAKEAELAEARKGGTNTTGRVKELEDKVKELQGEKKALEKEHKGKLAEVTQGAQLAVLRARMAGKLDPDYADVLAQKDDVRKRIRVNEDGTVDVMQADGKVPFSTGEGKDSFDLLVDELAASASKDTRTQKFVLSFTDGGSGTGKGAGGQAATGDAKFFEGIRERAKAEQDGSRPEGFKSGAERLGVIQAV